MARRGVMTALQAALAGIGGAAGGYVQMEETKRRRQQEEEARKRQQLMDTLSLFEKGAMEVGPIATRAPRPAQPIAAAGQAVAAPPQMGAIPLAGVGQEAMQAAERGLDRFETGGPGALRFEMGGRQMALPTAATRRAEAEQDALSAAIQQAEATGAVRVRQEREQFDVGNRRQFEVYKQQYGGRGAYNPNLDYASLNEAKETALGRASAREIAGIRTTQRTDAGTTGGAAGGRGPLPSVTDTVSRLNEMSDRYVLALRPSGIVAAAEAPLVMSESRGLLKAPAMAIAGAMNAYSSPEEREYALIIRSVNDAVARASEKGVLTDRDIARFQSQVLPLSRDDEMTSIRKFEILKGWANWLASSDPNVRLPDESIEEFLDRKSRLGRTSGGR